MAGTWRQEGKLRFLHETPPHTAFLALIHDPLLSLVALSTSVKRVVSWNLVYPIPHIRNHVMGISASVSLTTQSGCQT